MSDTLSAPQRQHPRRAAPSVIEAVAYSLRADVGALRAPSTQQYLSELDEGQMRGLAERLTKERWNKTGTARVPPWTPTEIEIFIETWRALQQ